MGVGIFPRKNRKALTVILGVCPLVLQKVVLCVPFLHGWWVSCGQQIQANVRGNVQQMLGGGGGGTRCPAPSEIPSVLLGIA